MKAQSRDKVALVVFFGMVALAVSGLVGYLMIGHTWNVAASNIDDATGSMEGYTTIVYEGTVDRAVQQAVPDEVNPELDSSLVPGGEDLELDPSISDPLSSASAETEDGEEGLQDMNQVEEDTNEPEKDAKASSLSKVMDINKVVQSYRDKQSAVFKLDIAFPTAYNDPMILKKGEKRIAVFNVLETDTAFKIERQVSSLEKYNVDYIIAIVPDASLVKSISGIDIVISTADEDLFVMGETVDGTFYVAAPIVGSVGAIIISPSGVVSAKVLTST